MRFDPEIDLASPFTLPTPLTTRQPCGTIDEDEAATLKRTAHDTPTRTRVNRKKVLTSQDVGHYYVEHTECSFTQPSRGAETADRAERQAYAGRKFRSAYAHLICLPPFVAPGDRTTCYHIVQDVEAAIAKGGWTTNEWNRLHTMHRLWLDRYNGKDVGFNLRGWRKKGTGHHTPPIEKSFTQIRKEIATYVGL